MPTDLKETADDVDDDSRAIRYDYKASLVGSAHQFKLTDRGLAWEVAGRSGV